MTLQNLYIAIATILIWVGSLLFAQYVVSPEPSWPVRMRSAEQEKTRGSQRVGTDSHSYQHHDDKFDEAPGANEAPKADPNPERKEWREEQDVQAQNDMATYARWSAYISATGVALTLAGLWFIKRSLEVSQKQLIAAHRPWVSVGAEIISPMTFRNGGFSIKIRFLCENIGGSPASRHTLFAEIFPSQMHAIDNIKAVTDFARSMSERELKINLPIYDGIVLFQTGKAAITRQLSIDAGEITAFFASDDWCRKLKTITPTIIGCASYVSTIDQSYHQTGFILTLGEVGPHPENGNFVVRFIENGEIPAEGLTLQQLGTLSPPIY